MALFHLRGVDLDIPEHVLRAPLIAALSAGRYEGAEADAVQRHLGRGERFMDLGAGAGYLCCLAARITGAERVIGVEAAPVMVATARRNLALNGHDGARILRGAVVGPDHAGDTVAFAVRPAFWASALAGTTTPPNALIAPVPARRLADLLARHEPAVLCCDIEGAEREVLAIPLPDTLRVIVVEMHPGIYGAEGQATLLAGLAAQGFHPAPDAARGTTLALLREG